MSFWQYLHSRLFWWRLWSQDSKIALFTRRKILNLTWVWRHRKVWNIMWNTLICIFIPQASKIWTLSDYANYTKFWALEKKLSTIFDKALATFMEEVYVTKTIVWCYAKRLTVFCATKRNETKRNGTKRNETGNLRVRYAKMWKIIFSRWNALLGSSCRSRECKGKLLVS